MCFIESRGGPGHGPEPRPLHRLLTSGRPIPFGATLAQSRPPPTGPKPHPRHQFGLIGGGLWRKEDVSVPDPCVAVGRAKQRPVKIGPHGADRSLVHPKRHATIIKLRSGVARRTSPWWRHQPNSRRLLPLSSLINHVMLRNHYPLRRPVRLWQRPWWTYDAMYTNNCLSGPFAAFASSERFAMESQMDVLPSCCACRRWTCAGATSCAWARRPLAGAGDDRSWRPVRFLEKLQADMERIPFVPG